MPRINYGFHFVLSDTHAYRDEFSHKVERVYLSRGSRGWGMFVVGWKCSSCNLCKIWNLIKREERKKERKKERLWSSYWSEKLHTHSDKGSSVKSVYLWRQSVHNFYGILGRESLPTFKKPVCSYKRLTEYTQKLCLHFWCFFLLCALCELI